MYRYAVPFAYYRQEIDSNKLRLAGRWLRNQVLNSYPSETHGLWYLFHSYSKGERISFAILFIEFISGYLENIYIKVIKRNAEYHLGLENIKMEDRKQRNNFFFTIYISIAQNNYENLEASVNRSFPSANYIIISFQNIQIKLKIASIRDYRKHRNVKNVAQRRNNRPSKETSNVEK